MQIKNKLRKHLIQLTKFICKSEWFTHLRKNVSGNVTKRYHTPHDLQKTERQIVTYIDKIITYFILATP